MGAEAGGEEEGAGGGGAGERVGEREGEGVRVCVVGSEGLPPAARRAPPAPLSHRPASTPSTRRNVGEREGQRSRLLRDLPSPCRLHYPGPSESPRSVRFRRPPLAVEADLGLLLYLMGVCECACVKCVCVCVRACECDCPELLSAGRRVSRVPGGRVACQSSGAVVSWASGWTVPLIPRSPGTVGGPGWERRGGSVLVAALV